MAVGWRRQKRSPPAVRTSPSSVAARREPALRRLASGRRRPGGERRWRHSSPISRRRPRCADWPPRCWPAIQSWMCVNNAGAMYGTRQLTKDGIELTWAANHLAPFLLSKLLLHRLKESAPARIITTASQAHQGAHIPFDDLTAERSYRGFGRYCETKLANVLFTTELARRLDGTGVTANCFHPGLVATGFNRNNGLLTGLAMTVLRPVSRSPEKGAETLVWLATSPDIANLSGAYFFDQEQRPPSPEAQDRETARRLWDVSERQCAVSGRSAEARSD